MAQSTEGLDLRSEQSRGYLLRLEWDAMGEAGEVVVVVMCVCVCVVMLYEKQSSRGVLHVVWRTIRQLKYAAAVN